MIQYEVEGKEGLGFEDSGFFALLCFTDRIRIDRSLFDTRYSSLDQPEDRV
jgi:hypothetical protein